MRTLKATLVILGLLLVGLAQPSTAVHEVVGSPGCKTCHRAKTGNQWTIWTESAHAGAYVTLNTEQARKITAKLGIGDPTRQPQCLVCHTTGGYLGADVPISSKGKYTDEEGVGCEACHGPGSAYKPGKIMKEPMAARAAGLVMDRTATACIGCHNANSPTFKGFEFEARWQEIAHPVPLKDAAGEVSATAEPEIPGVITFDSSVGVVTFAHQRHNTQYDAACEECHHQIRAGQLVTPHPGYLTSSWVNCDICHKSGAETVSQVYRCSVCHHAEPSDIADETLSAKVVVHKSCWNCHESGTGKAASQGCDECHVRKAANTDEL